MSYSPPSSTAVNASWAGLPSYTPPASTVVNASWAATITGAGVGVVPITGGGAGELVFLATGTATVSVSGEASGYYGDVVSGVGEGSVSVSGGGEGVSGSAGGGGGLVSVSGGGSGDHGASGVGSGVVPISGTAVGEHGRYELVGVVKLGGVLVNRRVRAYLRSSGALVAEADTVGGAFRLPVGFEEAEFYVTPIDLSPGATDWKPPTANRVVSVLAVDP